MISDIRDHYIEIIDAKNSTVYKLLKNFFKNLRTSLINARKCCQCQVGLRRDLINSYERLRVDPEVDGLLLRYVALTLSAEYACHAYKEALTEIMSFVDILFANRDEAMAYAAANQLSVADSCQIARHMAQLPKANGRRGRVIVITCDSQPTIVVEHGVVTRYLLHHDELRPCS